MSSATKNTCFGICCGNQDKKRTFYIFSQGTTKRIGVNFTFFIRQEVNETKKVKNSCYRLFTFEIADLQFYFIIYVRIAPNDRQVVKSIFVQ